MSGVDLDLGAPSVSGFTYDVIVSLPADIDRPSFERRAKEKLGSSAAVVQQLMQSLIAHRIIKVKASIGRVEADEVAARFTRAGFIVEIAHAADSRGAEKPDESTRIECPSCDAMVFPTADTRCSNCGVFINKLTPEFLERKRQIKAERARMEETLNQQKQLEEQHLKDAADRKIRDEVRLEVEREYLSSRKPRLLERVPGFSVPIIVCLLLAVGFFAGRLTGGGLRPGRAPTMKSQADARDASDATLAQSGTGPGGSSSPAGDLAGAASAPSTPALVLPPAPLIPLTDADARREVSTQLILLIAESGQLDRARDLASKLPGDVKGAPPKQVAQARILRMKLEAWAIAHNTAPKSATEINGLVKAVAELSDPADRSVTGASIAAILLTRTDFAPEDVAGLTKLSDEALKALKGAPGSNAVGHEMYLARGKGLRNAARVRADAGKRNEVVPMEESLDAMAHLAPDDSAAVLYGFDQEVSRMAGNAEGAQDDLALALTLTKVGKSGSLPEEASTLRSIANGGVYQAENVQASVAKLNAAAEKAGGADLAAVLVQDGLMEAENGTEQGLRAIQHKLDELAKANPKLIAFDERLRGLSELALASRARHANDTAAMEVHLRRAEALTN